MIMSKTSPFQISVCTAHRTISRGRLQQNLTAETSAYQQAISGSQRTGIAGTRKTADKRRLYNARSTPGAAKLPPPYGRKKPCVQGRKTAARRGRSIARHRRFEPFRFQTDSQPLSDSKNGRAASQKSTPSLPAEVIVWDLSAVRWGRGAEGSGHAPQGVHLLLWLFSDVMGEWIIQVCFADIRQAHLTAS